MNSEAPERSSSALTERLITCGRGILRKKWTEQLIIGNIKVMELKLIKHDEALGDIQTFPGSQKNSEAPERLSSALTERRGWSADQGQAAHELKQSQTNVNI